MLPRLENYVHYFPTTAFEKVVLFSEEKKQSVVFCKEEGGYSVDDKALRERKAAVCELYQRVVEKGLLPQLFIHMGQYPKFYTEVCYCNRGPFKNRFLLNEKLVECACYLYDRTSSARRELMEKHVVREIKARCPKDRKLEVMILGGGGALEMLLHASQLYAEGYRDIHFLSVEPVEVHKQTLSAFNEFTQTLIDGGVKMQIAVEWEKDVHAVSQEKRVDVVIALDSDFLSWSSEDDDTLQVATSHLSDQGIVLCGFMGLHFQLVRGGVEFFKPYLERPVWYVDWVNRCNTALERCGENLTVFAMEPIEKNFFPLVYLINTFLEKKGGQVTLFVEKEELGRKRLSLAGVFATSPVEVKFMSLSSFNSSQCKTFDVAFLRQPCASQNIDVLNMIISSMPSPSTAFTLTTDRRRERLFYDKTFVK